MNTLTPALSRREREFFSNLLNAPALLKSNHRTGDMPQSHKVKPI